jgi:hypothetical protein
LRWYNACSKVSNRIDFVETPFMKLLLFATLLVGLTDITGAVLPFVRATAVPEAALLGLWGGMLLVLAARARNRLQVAPSR